jgi:hypothetical protein
MKANRWLPLTFASLLGLTGAAAGSAHAQLRIFAIPQVGAGAEISANQVGDGLYSSDPAIEVWSAGAQIEAVGTSRWTPLLGFYRWQKARSCPASVECDGAGWSLEGGITRSFGPTSAVRPYGGAAAGIQRWGERDMFLQGRAGVDFTPARSILAFRLEGRYQAAVAASNLLLLNTGLRIHVW